MRWKDGRESDNIEDRRGMGIPRGAKIGGIGGLGLLAIVLIGMFFGIDPTVLLQSVPQTQSPPASVERGRSPAINDDQRKFVAVVLAETEDVWRGVFQKGGRTYQAPKLVLFSGAVESACGMAGSANTKSTCFR